MIGYFYVTVLTMVFYYSFIKCKKKSMNLSFRKVINNMLYYLPGHVEMQSLVNKVLKIHLQKQTLISLIMCIFTYFKTITQVLAQVLSPPIDVPIGISPTV